MISDCRIHIFIHMHQHVFLWHFPFSYKGKRRTYRIHKYPRAWIEKWLYIHPKYCGENSIKVSHVHGRVILHEYVPKLSHKFLMKHFWHLEIFSLESCIASRHCIKSQIVWIEYSVEFVDFPIIQKYSSIQFYRLKMDIIMKNG